MNAKTIEWTAEQSAIFDCFASGEGNAIVEALAGSGKTTTIKEAFGHATTQGKMLYAVFNKRNQVEAEAKIKDPRVEVKTLHSLGLNYLRKVWGKLNADFHGNVEFDRIRTALAGMREANNREICGLIKKLVSFLKNETISPTQQDAYEIAERRDCLIGDYEGNETIVCAALRVLEISRIRDAEGRVSGDDMVWLPVALDIVTPWFDLVCIDEAQDMNLPQLTMARKASKGRVIVVGDRNQAIYGFRGAASSGMSMMKISLRAKELGLTISQRCAKLVAQEAAKLVPAFKATETAPDGKVEYVRDCFAAQPQDAILSRLNAPLMPLALQFLRKDIPARIEGRDLGQQLLNMIRGFKADSVEELIGKIREWERKQCERAAINAKGNEEKIAKKCEQTRDVAGSLIALTEGLDTVQAVVSRIDALFADTDGQSKPAVVLSTVHKAKGLEWDRVFMLCETFGKNPKADANEEKNILYVAITRARRELYYVSSSAAPKISATSTPAESAQPAPSPKIKLPARAAAFKTLHEIKATAPKRADDDYDLMPGARYYQRGDVRLIEGKEYVCEMCNPSRSRWVCLTRETATITDKVWEKSVTFKKARHTVSITASYFENENPVIRKMTEQELKEFLTHGAKRSQNKQNNNGATETKDSNMPKTAKPAAASLVGRSEYIRKLKADGVKRAGLMERVNKKYPGSSPKKCYDVYDAKPKPAKPAKEKKETKPAKKTALPARKPAKSEMKKVAPTPEPAPSPSPAATLPPRREESVAPELTEEQKQALGAE